MEVDPGAEDDEPVGHAVQALDPALEYVVEQSMHTLASVAPVTLEYFPAGHPVQKDARTAFEYLPASHFVHSLAPLVEYSPDVQFMHILAFIAQVTLEYVPAGQLLHCPSQYLPSGHKTQLEDA
jgi:hypothetical protein